MTMKNPPHPGLSVRHDCIEPLGLTITEAADILGVTRQTLNNLVNGKSGISADMAIRLDKAFGGGAETWLRLQMAYDLAQARQHEADINVKPVSRRKLHEPHLRERPFSIGPPPEPRGLRPGSSSPHHTKRLGPKALIGARQPLPHALRLAPLKVILAKLEPPAPQPCRLPPLSPGISAWGRMLDEGG
jgi:addiction module HigA family antidote